MELRLASQKLGMRFLKTFAPLCTNALIQNYVEAVHAQHATGHYSIAFGIYAQALAISKVHALTGFYYNAASAMVTNCVKLIPLGQQSGQVLLFSLNTLVQQLVQQTLQPKRELIGRCCAGFDIRSMQHEELYSRLYMS
jgi:urease accessory protein